MSISIILLIEIDRLACSGHHHELTTLRGLPNVNYCQFPLHNQMQSADLNKDYEDVNHDRRRLSWSLFWEFVSRLLV